MGEELRRMFINWCKYDLEEVKDVIQTNFMNVFNIEDHGDHPDWNRFVLRVPGNSGCPGAGIFLNSSDD